MFNFKCHEHRNKKGQALNIVVSLASRYSDCPWNQTLKFMSLSVFSDRRLSTVTKNLSFLKWRSENLAGSIPENLFLD